MTNPYRGLPDANFWSSAVTSPAPGQIDPVTKADRIGPIDAVATIGSCFAQHLANHLRGSGLNYYIAEKAPAHLSAEDARQRMYGVFSARYGNVYTVRQAVQLLDRAFGRFKPKEWYWEKGGCFFDAFRPQVEPDGFSSLEELRSSLAEHLARVKDVFRNAKWLVFTLGLTEAWRSKLDGAIYPLAPGVAAGSFDPEVHEFVNFSASEVSADLSLFLEHVVELNPSMKVILSVSPVPLMATYEKRHVLSSTVFSKSALRVAADEAERRFSNVIYFPSYEIITSPASSGRYFEDDLRQVTDIGVAHVMQVFEKHFFENPSPHLTHARAQSLKPAVAPLQPLRRTDEVIFCDEEAIARSLRD